MNFVFVILGGAAGALARYVIFMLLEKKMESFPWHTLLINLTGCFLIGILTEFFALKSHFPLPWKLFLITGFLSSFTTFSTFAMETGLLIERHEYLKSSLYMIMSVVLGVCGYFFAIWVTRGLIVKE